MNILFLDFDGVFICCAGPSARLPYPPAVDALNDLIKRTNSQVVVSSAWRIGWTIEKLQQTLDEFGVWCKVIGKTCNTTYDHDSNKQSTRGEEIAEWLGECGFGHRVTDFVVVDDETCDMTNLPQDKILYVEDGWFNKGLTQEMVDKFLERK
ncbi:MAG: HAD domain-containing protein [Candidatus Paceibacterota bacterium]